MTSTLAQKMREGIAISKPLKKYYIRRDYENSEDVCARALGAALLACDVGQDIAALEACTQTNTLRWVQHPILEVMLPLSVVIVELNDDYDWPREQIADWVEEVTRDWE